MEKRELEKREKELKELEKKEKELSKTSLYNKLYQEKTIDAKKEVLKQKMSKAMEENNFAGMTAIAKEISNLAKENESNCETEKLLSIREIKKVLSSIISLIPESGIDLIVCGIRFKTKAESKSVKIDSGITLEKNKTVERVSAKKDGIVSIARRICKEKGLEGLRSFTFHSDTKQARNWLLKNFPEALENR